METYILLEQALGAVQHQCRPERSPAQNRMLTLIRHELLDIPAANVAPVVRGCWERVDSSYWRWTPSGGVPVSHITYRCGHCYRGTAVKSAYCPNCGARMDGDPDGLR